MKNVFDPFQDRLSREIRNDLSASLVKVLAGQDITAAIAVADRYLRQTLPACYKGYIKDRVAKYVQSLGSIQHGPKDIFWQALVLWDQQLFFEVHEVLEHVWLEADGGKKLVLQAMIRAAGVYIKLEYGYHDAARKIANRALPVLEENKEFLADYFEPEVLLTSLIHLSLPPPNLLDSSRSKRR